MEQRLSIITIGAENLSALRDFYSEQFGWRVEAQTKDIVFFKLNGLLFSLYGRENVRKMTRKQSSEQGGFVLAYLVDTPEQVRELYQKFVARKVTIVQTPEEPPFGGLFFLASDPEGNIWEFCCNPYIHLDTTGNVVSHDNIDHL